MKNPRISVACPVLNVEKYIAETIESVQAQSFQDWELIIMDGVSKDRTVEIARKYAESDPRIRVYSEPDECAQHGYDKILDLFHGDFFCTMCGQDVYSDPDWFKKCVAAFDADPQLSLVWSLTQARSVDDKMLDGQFDTYYSQLMPNENTGGVLATIAKKGTSVARDLLFGSQARRRIILDKIFSKSAKLQLNALTNRNFKDGVPQKQAWFWYWLDTALTFHDLSMMSARKATLACTPRYQLGHRVAEYTSDFFYNFNSEGYLAHFIPANAVLVRVHPGNSSDRAGAEMHKKTLKYLDNVVALRSELLDKGEPMVFRDRAGDPIAAEPR
jgi:glycosyltransferase involved in cell wall biosynthesis